MVTLDEYLKILKKMALEEVVDEIWERKTKRKGEKICQMITRFL